MNKIGKIYLWILSIISLIFISYFMFSFNRKSNINEAINNLSNSSYLYSGYVNYLDDNTYYRRIDKMNSFKKNNKSTTNILMTNENKKYFGNYLTKYKNKEVVDSTLSEMDASISIYTSELFKLGIGDKLEIDLGGTIFNYKVKYIFDNYFGFDDINTMNMSPLIILGYNANLIDLSGGYELYGFAEGESSFKPNSPIFEKNKIILPKLYSDKNLRIIVDLIIVIAAIVFVELVLSKNNEHDFTVLRRYNYRKKDIFKFSFINTIYQYFVIFIPTIILLSLYILISSSNYWLYLVNVLIYLLLTIVISSLINIKKIRSL